MSLNTVRRLVSGKKARFVTEDGSELDLCYITDRILICGWPGSGVEALYRNDRAVVRKFLTSRYGTHFRIFNFVPRFENEYDAAYFNHQVSRFPFPDHHPPPLSMIPLVTRRMQDWIAESDKNVIVIHCKAGKGRSGTMCCCYLLSLPTLPQPPSLPQNQSKRKSSLSQAPPQSDSIPGSPPEIDSEDDETQLPRTQSGGAAMDLAGQRGSDRHTAGRQKIARLVQNLATSDTEGEGNNDTIDGDEDPDNKNTADLEALGMADKLDQIFQLHTSQRMKPAKKPTQDSVRSGSSSDTSTKPKKPVRGVSIPSQRRFVNYWSKVLTRNDPRPLDLLAPPNPSRVDRLRRQALVTEIRVYMPKKMPGFPGLINKKPVSVHLARYQTSFVDSLEKRELALREMRRLEKKFRRADYSDEKEKTKLEKLRSDWLNWDDKNWKDKHDLFEREGALAEVEASADVEGAEESSTGDFRRLIPAGRGLEDGIPVDADREVQFKLLIGDSGKRHSLLPDVGSLGYAWIIPSFETNTQPTLDEETSLRFSVTIDSTEIDFFKSQSGITKFEIDMMWSVH